MDKFSPQNLVISILNVNSRNDKMKMTQHHQISLMWPFIQRFCSTWMRWLKSENENTVLNNSYEKGNSLVILESAIRQTIRNVWRSNFFHLFYICIVVSSKLFKDLYNSIPKIFQAKLQQYVNRELPHVQAGFT